MWVLMILVMLNYVWSYSCIVQFQTNTKKVEQSMSGPHMNEKITAELLGLCWMKVMYFISG